MSRFLCPRFARALRVVGAGVGASLLSGCSVMPPAPKPAVEVEVGAAAEKVAVARSRSLERAVGGINAETVSAWINRYTAPAGQNSEPSGPREVRIDVDALARRHVAWRLADELQRDAIAPTQARSVRVTVPATNADSVVARADKKPAIPDVNALPVRPARSVATAISQRGAIVASRASLDDFLSDLRARQNELEVAESDLARRALEDRIRASTRGAVEAITLAPVSPAIALELSNLRLKLLDQLSVPVARRAEAATEIEAIEKRLNEIWERQTIEQNARLRAAFEELPARLRREGVAALDAASAARESERYYARLELRTLIENRLNSAAPGASDTQILRLLLPPARIAITKPSGNGSSQTRARGATSAASQTNGEVREAQARDGRSLGQSDTVQVAQLRAQARRDARQWATNLALSWDAKLSDKREAPDRTNLAIAKLFETAR